MIDHAKQNEFIREFRQRFNRHALEEIVRYRRALEEIVRLDDACVTESDEHQAMRKSASVAREALNGSLDAKRKMRGA